MCLWQPILWRKLFTCRLPNPCLSPLSQLSSSSERPRVHCDHTRVHNTRPRPRPTIMPAAKNASKKKNDKEGLAVKKTVKTKAAPKPKKEKKPKAPKPKAAPKKKVIFFLFSTQILFLPRLQRNNLDLNTVLPPVPVHCCNIVFENNE